MTTDTLIRTRIGIFNCLECYFCALDLSQRGNALFLKVILPELDVGSFCVWFSFVPQFSMNCKVNGPLYASSMKHLNLDNCDKETWHLFHFHCVIEIKYCMNLHNDSHK